jgi:multidrug efflux pump subunit AcrB
MSGFAIRNPHFIVVVALIVLVLGTVSVVSMPVDMFPTMNMPVVAVATFYSGMPPQQIESDITYHLERQFTLGSGIDHIESRSLPGVSLIKVYFHPGTNADTDAAMISTLAMSDLRDMPPGTYPPIVLKADPSNLPVCLVALGGEGLNDSALKDVAQNFIRNQLASVPGSSVPQPFGGRWRQIMLYADPYKLEANQLSPMDLVRSINEQNVILPAGDAQIGRYDYNIYTNALLKSADDIDQVPIKMIGQSPVRVGDVAVAKDSYALQYNIVRVDGRRSVYLPIFKQGGDSNTIAIVNGIREGLKKLHDVPASMTSSVVFDQSRFVKTAIETLLHEGVIGLLLTCVMILIFLGSARATVAVFFSIPLSVLVAFIIFEISGNSINSMILGGLALALSRLIDNSVVVLENIFRHLEAGEPALVAAEKGGTEVELPVLAATLTTVVVFFPVVMLYGVSRFLFTALAVAVIVSLFASYFVAMTVVPLFCARYIKGVEHYEPSLETSDIAAQGVLLHSDKSNRENWAYRFNAWFANAFERMLVRYDALVGTVLMRPRTILVAFAIVFVVCVALFPFVGRALFPQTDAGQFVINFKAPSGTRLDATEQEAARLEQLIRSTVRKGDLNMIVSNLGVDPGFSALYSSNAAMHTGFTLVSLNPGHEVGSYEYIDEVKRRMAQEMPELSPFFSSGSLVDSVLNMGSPAPIDLQVSGSDLNADYGVAQNLAAHFRQLRGVADVYVPQDLDYPSLRLNVDRMRATELGLTEREVVSNVITALTSNQMIAPSIWIDPNSGNNYFLTVQYNENQIKSVDDLRAIPLHGARATEPTRLDMVADITRFSAPTEVDHNQIRRRIDVYIRPSTEDLGSVASRVEKIIANTHIPSTIDVTLGGSIDSMNASFRSFAVGLILSVVLLYLILVAQFRSFVDPFIILIALPPGIAGVILTLLLTGTTLNVMSLMGVIMLAGIAMSNSILIVEFAHHLIREGSSARDAIVMACRVRLRPVLMTSLATVIGLLPMALKLGEGSESYAPLARVLIGGLVASAMLTVFLVPAAFYLCYSNRKVSHADAR